MDSARWHGVAKGIGFSFFYCLAYLAAWFNSVDQWFLPAGVRAASMLFLPFRYWPYLLIGDATALLMIRVPIAWQSSTEWALLSPLLLPTAISIVPLAFRKRLKSIQERPAWIPAIAISIAIWSSLCNLSINYLLSGPRPADAIEIFLRYVIGDCLGILMIVPPTLVWLLRKSDEYAPRKFAIDASICLAMIAVMLAATMSPDIQASLRQLLMIMMLLPAAGLTVLHGWRGAALAVAAVNIAIPLAPPHLNASEAHDETAFVAQQALLVVAIALLWIGAVMSKLFDKARRLGVSERHAMDIARTGFLSPQNKFREKVLHMAQMQVALDEQRRRIVSHLKNLGHYSAAMDLNAEGVELMATFERHSMAIYPPQIESEGLFSALHTPSFSKLWAGDAEIMLLTKGQPRNLSRGLQFAAYYCVGNAFALLSEFNPDFYEVKARVWKRQGHRGITVIVTARPTTDAQPSEASMIASLELEGRAKAHGGSVKRRHAHQVSLMLSERAGISPLGIGSPDSPGTVAH
jgi:hypothetical protein